MLLHGQRGADGILLNLHHVLLELGGVAPGDLPPVEVCLTVVVDEGGGVNAPYALNLPHVGEGARGGLGLGHTATSVGDAVVEVVPAVAVGAIGSVQYPAILRPGGIADGKGDAVIRPMDQIIGGKNVVDGTAKAGISLMIHGSVQVDATVPPCVSFHVGDEDMTIQNGIVSIIKTHGKNLLVCMELQSIKLPKREYRS